MNLIDPIGFAAELAAHAERHGPVTIGLAGAGQMGTDIVVQAALMRGIRIGAIAASRPRRGRLRGGLIWSVAGLAALAALLWLPGAMMSHAARIAPPAQRNAVGLAILGDLRQTTGAPCDRASGAAVLDRLSARLLGPEGRIVVLPATIRGARALPGRMVIIGDDMIAGQPGPEVAAGHVLAADLSAAAADPLAGVVRRAGIAAALRMLVSGSLPAEASGRRALVRAQYESKTPILLVPQVFVWSKRADDAEQGLVDTLFGPREWPGKLRTVAQFLGNYRHVTLRAGEPVRLDEFVKSEAGQPDDALVRRLTYVLLRRLERERRGVVGPVKKPSDRLREQVLRSPKLQKTILDLGGRGAERRGAGPVRR